MQMNLPLSHLFLGLLTLAVLYLLANRSAFAVLRRKNIPRASAGIMSGILTAAFFVVYLFIGVVAYIAFLSPQRAEIVRVLLPPPPDIAFSTPSISVPLHTEAPQGRMTAEQEQTKRQQLIAAMTDQVIRAAVERHQAVTQDQPYVIFEGISGTEDRYLSPKAALPQSNSETTISVQKAVSFADEISGYFNDIKPQAVQSNGNSTSTPLEQNKPIENDNSLREIAPLVPAIQQNTPTQPVQTQNVSCGEIRMYMDATDLQIFNRAIRQREGIPTSWKGPGGSYTITPAASKGTCREYSMQANLSGRQLRCYASCTSIDQAIQAAATNAVQQNDEAVILHSMNSNDQDALIKALTYSGPVSWRSVSGVFYTVSPVRLGNPCREYKVKANIQGQVFEYLESNCR